MNGHITDGARDIGRTVLLFARSPTKPNLTKGAAKTWELNPGNSRPHYGTHSTFSKGRFDWVMMHHSFEHVVDSRALLASVQGMLTNDGRVLIRMPVTGWAWRNCRVNWVPLMLLGISWWYTIDGFQRIPEGCGFLLDDVFHDSETF